MLLICAINIAVLFFAVKPRCSVLSTTDIERGAAGYQLFVLTAFCRGVLEICKSLPPR